MVATSFDSERSLEGYYTNACNNINELKSLGCTVIHEIDAKTMATDSSLSFRKFDRIIFNFPFEIPMCAIGRSTQIKRHQNLVKLFFENAKKLLAAKGEIHVTHKTNHFHCEWDLPELASLTGLRFIELVEFQLNDYPGYINKYGYSCFPQDKTFNWDPSSTFKFGHA